MSAARDSASLEGRRAIVTGASSGIGEATALALADEGAAVALVARRADRLEALAERISAAGGIAHAIEADVADELSAQAAVDGAAELMGGLDALINNAGVMLLGLLERQDPADWRTMFEVNALGLVYCTQRALPLMREAGGGDIVNVASTAGRVASLGTAVYNFTKFGLVGFSEALRQEGMHSAVRVTCVEPGFVDTELQGHNTDQLVVKATEHMREEIGQVLEAADIARAILYALEQPPHVSVNEILVRPSGQKR